VGGVAHVEKPETCTSVGSARKLRLGLVVPRSVLYHRRSLCRIMFSGETRPSATQRSSRFKVNGVWYLIFEIVEQAWAHQDREGCPPSAYTYTFRLARGMMTLHLYTYLQV